MTGMKIPVHHYIHGWICQKLLPFAQTYRTGVRIPQYIIASEMDADTLDLLSHFNLFKCSPLVWFYFREKWQLAWLVQLLIII